MKPMLLTSAPLKPDSDRYALSGTRADSLWSLGLGRKSEGDV